MVKLNIEKIKEHAYIVQDLQCTVVFHKDDNNVTTAVVYANQYLGGAELVRYTDTTADGRDMIEQLRLIIQEQKESALNIGQDLDQEIEVATHMKTLDWRNRRITLESLNGFSDCNIILDESQFDDPEFQQCIIRNGYYLSKLYLLFEEAYTRNINFITPERAQKE